MSARVAEVVVVGGGPVGLLAALLLAGEGVEVVVLERRARRGPHSRAIGVHPPALEALARAGVADALLAAGVAIRRGHAFAGRTRLGTLRFDACPPPYGFVLALPQADSERVLEERLRLVAPGAMVRGVEVVGLDVANGGVRARLRGGDSVEGAVLLGCDGERSRVRPVLGATWTGVRHADHFVMADLPDATDFGADAAIFLTTRGVVESFPLPGGRRRWVAPLPVPHGSGPRAVGTGGGGNAAFELTRVVRDLLGYDLDPSEARLPSTFGVASLRASRMAAGRMALAGDAAHVMPPFGGQGMNLGWLDAEALALALVRGRRAARGDLREAGDEAIAALLSAYQRPRLVAARRATRRAEINLRLGRRWAVPAVRSALLRVALETPMADVLARTFTMRGLAGGPSAGPLGARAAGAAVPEGEA